MKKATGGFELAGKQKVEIESSEAKMPTNGESSAKITMTVKVKKPRKLSPTCFKKGNQWAYKPGDPRLVGKVRSGQTTKPRLLSQAYRAWLALEDEHGVTNAMKVATQIGNATLKEADVTSAREIRTATEGTQITFKPSPTDAMDLSDDDLLAIIQGREVPALSAPVSIEQQISEGISQVIDAEVEHVDASNEE